MITGILILTFLLPIVIFPLALKTWMTASELDEMGIYVARPKYMTGSEIPFRLSAILAIPVDHC